MRLKRFDAETARTLARGCDGAEQAASAMYGENWREKYLQERLELRRREYPITGYIFKHKEGEER